MAATARESRPKKEPINAEKPKKTRIPKAKKTKQKEAKIESPPTDINEGKICKEFFLKSTLKKASYQQATIPTN